MKSSSAEQIRPLLKKNGLTVLITDSGLGGLSICASLAGHFKARPLVPQVSLVYYNAWPDQHRGYNSLAGDAERMEAFHQALAGMERFNPDLILIACNTLSVLYPHTLFSRTAELPVVDIIDFGTELIGAALAAHPGQRALILGTVTTIRSGEHVQRLVSQGVDGARLITQPCDQLATEIEMGPGSPRTFALVDKYMAQAARQVESRSGDICAALCCTHFGYCRELIHQRLAAHLPGRRITMLNPNEGMAGLFLKHEAFQPVAETRVTIRVVSKIRWARQRIQSIGNALAPVSPETVNALEAYEYIPDLFEFEI